MADAGFFKGTSADQDRRFADKEQKLLKSTKFPSNFSEKVDMRKVNLTVIQPWITKKIVELCGFEDDILIGYAIELLEESATPDPRKMQLSLQAFLAMDAPKFMSALWSLLLEAQNEVTGVPRTFVEQKKEEMRRARENDGRVFDERDRRARLDEINDSGRGRGRGRGRGGYDGGGRARGGYGYDDGRGRGRDSGWGGRGGGPPRRSRSRTPPGRYANRSPPRRRRSPSRDNDIHSSRSPPPRRRRTATPDSARSSRSRSPPPNRRRPRSRSRSPPPPRRNPSRSRGGRDSRSPPARRRRVSRSRSGSVSPPRRRDGNAPQRAGEREPLPRRRSSTPNRSRSRSPRRHANSNELKIKGQAEASRRASRWNEGEPPVSEEPSPTPPTSADLARRESELKEKALRNKVIRTRKTS